MNEIVKVKNDHGVLSVRIPREFIKAKLINRRDCLLWAHNNKGNLVLKTLAEGISDVEKIGNGKGQ